MERLFSERELRVLAPEVYVDEADTGHLTEWSSGRRLRKASQAEESASMAKASTDGWPGLILAEGMLCYVD